MWRGKPMRFSTRFMVVALLALAFSFLSSDFYSVFFLMVSVGMLYAFFYYRGKEVATEAIAMAAIQIGSNLKCDDCEAVPHLTEMNNRWLCDACYIKEWAKHCPVCGIEIPTNNVKLRQDHLDTHEKKGEL
jgi:hypothetical protein